MFTGTLRASFLRGTALVLDKSAKQLNPLINNKGYEFILHMAVDDRVEKEVVQKIPNSSFYAPGLSCLTTQQNDHYKKETTPRSEERDAYKKKYRQLNPGNINLSNKLPDDITKIVQDKSNKYIKSKIKKLDKDPSLVEFYKKFRSVPDLVQIILDVFSQKQENVIENLGLSPDELNTLSEIFSVFAGLALKEYALSTRTYYFIFEEDNSILAITPEQVTSYKNISNFFRKLVEKNQSSTNPKNIPTAKVVDKSLLNFK